jgi:hypothetical protein
VISGNASKSAANTQAAAARNASATDMAMYQQTRSDLMPYQTAGQQGTNQLMAQLPSLTANFNPTVAQLQQTPGYQFDLSQGLESAQNGFAARGLGSSGAAMKGAADYATGLANNTLTTQQGIFAANQTNAYNKLMGVSQLGESAASQTGNTGIAQTNAATGAAMSGANAQAAGTVGAANAYSNALSGIGNNAMMYGMFGNSGMFGPGVIGEGV